MTAACCALKATCLRPSTDPKGGVGGRGLSISTQICLHGLTLRRPLRSSAAAAAGQLFGRVLPVPILLPSVGTGSPLASTGRVGLLTHEKVVVELSIHFVVGSVLHPVS